MNNRGATETVFVTVKEFFFALKNPHTYNLKRNSFIAFGFLWGLPIPYVTLAIHTYALGLPVSLNSMSEVLRQEPLHYFFLAHPFIFAYVFGAMGTMRYVKDLNLMEMNRILKLQSILDPLTTVYNRRYFNDTIKSEVARAQRYVRPLSLLLIDMDGFKKLNDTYGHLVGDAVLVEVAKALKDNTRGNDSVCRYGGDEFAVIMPETTTDEALIKARNLREKVRGIEVSRYLKVREDVYVSVSIGIAGYGKKLRDEHSIIAAADSALFQAKNTTCGVRVYKTGSHVSVR